MTTFLLASAIFAIAMLGLGAGLLVKGKPLKRRCHSECESCSCEKGEK